jgi:hypothetical protein
MNMAIEMVDSPGPPLVSRYGSSNSCAALMNEVTMTKAEIGLIPGTVTAKKVRSRPAPSMAAASYCSAGTFCRAARKKIVR